MRAKRRGFERARERRQICQRLLCTAHNKFGGPRFARSGAAARASRVARVCQAAVSAARAHAFLSEPRDVLRAANRRAMMLQVKRVHARCRSARFLGHTTPKTRCVTGSQRHLEPFIA
eukprot:5535275-Pleurochrysis_carterae.AAC.2